MSTDPILLIGGSGVVGRGTARFLQIAHPDVQLLIGGRDLARAVAVASEVGTAQGVVLDLTAGDLGLGARPVRAVATLLYDDSLAGLRFA